MKVLLINMGHSRGGGAFTVYLNTTEMLRRSGVEVVNFALHSDGEIDCDQSLYFAREIKQTKPIDYVVKRFYNIDAAHCLQRLIDAEHPDVAHIHLMWGGLAPSILEVLKNNNIPVVHTVHDYAMICSLSTLRAMDGKPCERCKGGKRFEIVKTRCHKGNYLRSAIAALEMSYRCKFHHPVGLISHFIFVSHFCEKKHCEMDDMFSKSCRSVLYNVPDELVEKLSSMPVPNTYESYYLYFGRLSYEKGLDTLVRAFASRPNLKLKIVGSGPLKDRLMNYCKDLAIDNIEFLGFKSGENLYKIVRNAKYVCVPSEWYENNPMTIIEAYTLGTPVIAANIGGIPEIVVEKQTGFLFESGSIDGLLNALDDSVLCSNDEYEKMKNEVKDYSRLMFKREQYIRTLISLYRKVLDREQ